MGLKGNVTIKRVSNTSENSQTPAKILKMQVQHKKQSNISKPTLQIDDVKLKLASASKSIPNLSGTASTYRVIENIPEPNESTFPILTQEKFDKIESWTKIEATRNKLFDLLNSIKASHSNLVVVFSRIFSDEFLKDYSWDGKNDHKALGTTGLGNMITRVLKGAMSVAQFEKTVRVIIFQSHIRYSKNRNAV